MERKEKSNVTSKMWIDIENDVRVYSNFRGEARREGVCHTALCEPKQKPPLF